MANPHPPRQWDEVFLNALREVPVMYTAAKIAGISREMIYKRRAEDPAFKRAMDVAMEDGLDVNDANLHDMAKVDVKAAIHIATVRRYKRDSHNSYDAMLEKQDAVVEMVWEDGDRDSLPD